MVDVAVVVAVVAAVAVVGVAGVVGSTSSIVTSMIIGHLGFRSISLLSSALVRSTHDEHRIYVTVFFVDLL